MSLEQGAKVHGARVPGQSIYPKPVVLRHLCNKFTQVVALGKNHSCMVGTTQLGALFLWCKLQIDSVGFEANNKYVK